MTKSTKILLTCFVLITIISIVTTIATIISSQPTELVTEEIAVAPAIPGDSKPYNFDYSWADENPYIAHAFGGILGDTYTNSYEAFLLNYQLGQRVFEVDFYLTSDDTVVAAHDDEHWHSNTEATKEIDFTFSNAHSYLVEGRYHLLDYRQIIDIMVKYPDIYIVTDSKYTDEVNSRHQFSQIIEYAQSVDASVLDRFIIQIYNQEMLNWAMDIYPWRSVIYTLYADPTWTPENVLTFSQESGVKFITMWGAWVSEDLLSLWLPGDIIIGAHTIDDYGFAQDLFQRGVKVIYTNFLIP